MKKFKSFISEKSQVLTRENLRQIVGGQTSVDGPCLGDPCQFTGPKCCDPLVCTFVTSSGTFKCLPA